MKSNFIQDKVKSVLFSVYFSKDTFRVMRSSRLGRCSRKPSNKSRFKSISEVNGLLDTSGRCPVELDLEIFIIPSSLCFLSCSDPKEMSVKNGGFDFVVLKNG